MFIYKSGGDLDKINTYPIDGNQVKFFGNPDGSTKVKFNKVAMIASRYVDILGDLQKIIDDDRSTFPVSERFRLAVAFLIIIKTGIRVGNEDSAEGYMTTPHANQKDQESKFVQTYGISTMMRHHIYKQNGLVHFDFIGKKAVENKFILDHKLSNLVMQVYDSGFEPLFGIDESMLTSFIKKETSPYFSSKDFRTFRANVFGYNKAITLSKPKTKTQHNENVKKVTEFVSQKLNNTPGVVKSSYLDPRLFTYVFGDKSKL